MATVQTLNTEIAATYRYDYPPDPALCIRFIQAVRALTLFRPRFVTIDGNQVTFEAIKDMYRDAQVWLAANPVGSDPNQANGAGSTAYYGTNNIRGY